MAPGAMGAAQPTNTCDAQSVRVPEAGAASVTADEVTEAILLYRKLSQVTQGTCSPSDSHRNSSVKCKGESQGS